MVNKEFDDVFQLERDPTDDELKKMKKEELQRLYLRLLRRRNQIKTEFDLEKLKRKWLLKMKHLIEMELGIIDYYDDSDSGNDQLKSKGSFQDERYEEPIKLLTGSELTTNTIIKLVDERLEVAKNKIKKENLDLDHLKDANVKVEKMKEEENDDVKPKIKQEIKTEINTEIKSEPKIKREIKDEFVSNKKIKQEIIKESD